MSRFGHLRNVKKGDRDAAVSVSLHDYTPPKQRGWLDPGRYAMDVADADWTPAQNGAGVNLHLTHKSALPAEFAGVAIEDWIYLAFDDGGDEKSEENARIGYNKLQHLMRSIATATPGKFEALQEPGPDGKPKVAAIVPAKLIGKRCFVEVEPGVADVIGRDGRTRDFSGSSKIKWYTGREDFEGAPGPAKVAPRSAAEQKAAPELGSGRAAAAPAASGNGSGRAAAPQRPGQAPVSDLVDF